MNGESSTPTPTSTPVNGTTPTPASEPTPVNSATATAAPASGPVSAAAAQKPKSGSFNSKIIAIALGVIAVIVIAVIGIKATKKIDFNDYIIVEYDGYNTRGTASWRFDSESFEKDYGSKLKFDTFAQIDELNAKINLLKNGKPVNPVVQQDTGAAIFCRNCGARLAADAVFCTVCGTKLSEIAPEGEQAESV